MLYGLWLWFAIVGPELGDSFNEVSLQCGGQIKGSIIGCFFYL